MPFCGSIDLSLCSFKYCFFHPASPPNWALTFALGFKLVPKKIFEQWHFRNGLGLQNKHLSSINLLNVSSPVVSLLTNHSSVLPQLDQSEACKLTSSTLLRPGYWPNLVTVNVTLVTILIATVKTVKRFSMSFLHEDQFRRWLKSQELQLHFEYLKNF